MNEHLKQYPRCECHACTQARLSQFERAMLQSQQKPFTALMPVCDPFGWDDHLQAVEKIFFAKGLEAAARHVEGIKHDIFHRQNVANAIRALAQPSRDREGK